MDPRLPLPLLRDASGRLDHTRLQPDDSWPTRVAPPPTAPPLAFPLRVGSFLLPVSIDVDLLEEAAEAADSQEALATQFLHNGDAPMLCALSRVDMARLKGGPDEAESRMHVCCDALAIVDFGSGAEAAAGEQLLRDLAAATAFLPEAPTLGKHSQAADVAALRAWMVQQGWLADFEKETPDERRKRHVRARFKSRLSEEVVEMIALSSESGREREPPFEAGRFDADMEKATANFFLFHAQDSDGRVHHVEEVQRKVWRLEDPAFFECAPPTAETLGRWRLASLDARLVRREPPPARSGSGRAGASAPAGAEDFALVVAVDLEMGAFDLDRKLDEGVGSFVRGKEESMASSRAQEEFAAASLGDVEAEGSEARRALGRLLHTNLSGCPFSGEALWLGPDSDPETHNRLCGVGRDDVGADDEPAEADYDLSALLRSCAMSGTDHGASGAGQWLPPAAFANLRPSTTLHPFQESGVRWLAQKEAHPDRLTLHPAWTQVETAGGQLFYLHAWSGHCSACFFAAAQVRGPPCFSCAAAC